jgi:ABC-type nitrate/sulfonate/bicarbonate transport system permease component
LVSLCVNHLYFGRQLLSRFGAKPPSAKAVFWIAIAAFLIGIELAILFALLRLVFAAVTPLLAMIQSLPSPMECWFFNLIPFTVGF